MKDVQNEIKRRIGRGVDAIFVISCDFGGLKLFLRDVAALDTGQRSRRRR